MTNQKYEDLFTRHLSPAPLNNITSQLNAVNAQLGDTNLNRVDCIVQLVTRVDL